MDAGEDGLNRASAFLTPFLVRAVDETEGKELLDNKSLLYKFIQQDAREESLDELEYRLVSAEGPDHAKTFSVELYLASNRIGRGVGSTIQEAEQMAASEALDLFGVRH